MKTKFSFPLTIFLLLLSMIPFSSCSDDDEEVSSSNLIGTWQYTGGKGWEGYDGHKNEWIDDDTDDYTWTFKQDGTFIEWEGGSSYEYYDWKLKGNKLFIDGDEVTITTLTSNTLVVEMYEKDDDGWEYWEQMSFKKVK
ncbi:MAG: lipocalin family protein [Prevotellaceae bacterium]|nr:lipocalin family protein [Prevotellaceae bacterium]